MFDKKRISQHPELKQKKTTKEINFVHLPIPATIISNLKKLKALFLMEIRLK